MELQWVWKADPPYSHVVHSAAYSFRDGAGARRAFDAADELALFTGPLDVRDRRAFELAEAAVLLRGRGLNDTASGVVWRHGNVVAVVVVEPANDDAARELARKQQERIENPRHRPAQMESEPELQLDDPALALPVYWIGDTLDPPGALPALELESATVGGSGPGQSVQLWYAVGGVAATVTVDIWKPDVWARFRRTRLGRLVWDSPCAQRHVVEVDGGRAEIFEGYDERRPVETPCPTRPVDRVLAHVYYAEVVVAVNMPYAYCCVSNNAGPYGTLAATETLVRALRLRTD